MKTFCRTIVGLMYCAVLTTNALADNHVSCSSKDIATAQQFRQQQKTDSRKWNSKELGVENVKEILSTMRKSDQGIRNYYLDVYKKCQSNIDQKVLEKIGDIGTEIDSANLVELKAILDSVGWPSITKYGAAADNAALLVVQHADDTSFQQQVLVTLSKLPKNETDQADLALLYDRVHFEVDGYQYYGTQGVCKKGVFELVKLKDQKGVEDRRKAMGLEPLSAYVHNATKALCAASADGQN